MKRSLSMLSIFVLAAIGCSKPESQLAGKWKSPTVKGFKAEFSSDHTGATYTQVQGHAGTVPTKLPFKWTIEKDGTVKITEAKAAFTGKLVGKQLELEIDGAKSILVKSN